MLPGSNVHVGNPIMYHESGRVTVQVEIAWDNAWHNDRNHDAVWVFAKFVQDNGWNRHMHLLPAGNEIGALTDNMPEMAVQCASDGLGLIVHADERWRGDIRGILTMQVDTATFRGTHPGAGSIQVFAIEMVYVPQGAFYLGDLDARALDYGAMYLSDANGESRGPFRVNSEDQVIEVGATDGALYYRSDLRYQGDQSGPIPASFPKGVEPFYCMKYELSQGQYADFLNCISAAQTQFRANFGGRDYEQLRGTISRENNRYSARRPDRPCNFYSWDDAMAYADWAGLRPMTELEFTKACRGPAQPQAMEYPWGTGPKHEMLRRVNGDDDLVMLNGMDESDLSDATRSLFGASYYWVMDLAGSVWERVITIGDAQGRAFTGQHGDGRLTGMGYANVEDWPAGNDEQGGFGFRGGGYYRHDRSYTIFNPYSPIAFRRFGAWSGGVRSEAYGGRFVRTAE
ncbi:MAG: SUMF1/EgtB/PvdO family nonheme iron enzyme [Saprospiraceae bacterium]|nr:SUMF1/EgtB/PvdO family nonheme iron enzyme [Saprospiraceae bacterium]